VKQPNWITRWLAQLSAVALLLAAGPTTAAEIHVMISAGFGEAYAELAPAFERASGHKLVTTRGPSMGESPEAIPTRIKRGERVDLVIMVGAAVDDLIKQGLVRPGSKVDLARSEIGMVVRAGAAKPDIRSVDAFRQVLLDAKSIAYSDSASGTYLSTTLFGKLGVAGQTAGKSRKIKGPPSGEAVAAVVARGEAEIGFQQVSELIHVPGVSFVGPIPSELQQETFYSAALASPIRETAAAGEFIRFLASPQAAPAMARSGLAPLSR
jgi:molybdate transport system substrate-binding protein